jgi:tRNA threonylcarbamoyladenosine biosynthesis protein TsaB
MNLLALDTATEACSAALWLDGRVLHRYEVAGRIHTERLLPMIRELLAEAGVGMPQIDGFVCGVGPGSFAGVRIGVGLVKGLALAADRPVVGVSSLAMLAQAALDAGAERALACIDARMSEVYFGAYGRSADGLAVSLQEEVVAPANTVRTTKAGAWAAVGSGWLKYEVELKQALAADISSIAGGALPSALSALKLAVPAFERGDTISSDDLAPAYLRDRVALTLVEQAEARKHR